IAIAAVLLITVILPAEYAIDPSGIGKMLGLTKMGEIKHQLAGEAERDAIAVAAAEFSAPAIALDPVTSDPAIEPTVETAPPAEDAWRDEVVLTLKPGEAAEIKLVMNEGGIASYLWTVNQGHLNSDLHGDGSNGQSISYRKGRVEDEDTGELMAAFDGSHGWFWRNRSEVNVELTLRMKGAYSEVKRVL
ncbi:MAG: transmembrane anchor protein, partial [Gammaproteobacteria bacterium]|nr:transmembrane anchor protein [Gammaproteobacteria bacterium]